MTRANRPLSQHPGARAAAFALMTAALYVAALVVCARVKLRDNTLLQDLTHNTLTPGGQYQSLRRFREAASHDPVDVVVLGSSHAYRGFDPRIFAARGVRLFNLGSTNQTPLNSQYVAQLYLPRLAPRLVLVEIYYHTLSTDGLESCRDLAVNTPASWTMLRMAVATQNLGAVNFAAAKGLGLVADEARAEQRPTGGEVYIPGGYCEVAGRRDGLMPADSKPLAVEVQSAQLDALRALSADARARGARVLWVTHPLPRDHRALVQRPGEIRAAIDRAAAQAGVEYWDFNERLELDPLDDFRDFHHLNADGVRKFNTALLDALSAAGYGLTGPGVSPGR